MLPYTLKLFEGYLGSPFVRIHRKYLVNRQYIQGQDIDSILIAGGNYLPIARRRRL